MLLRALLLALTAGLAIAPAAWADSLAYVGNDGNVWISEPDGSAAHRVTDDGTPAVPYESPSQTDDGVVVAARGTGFAARLYRMRQSGELLGEPVPTPVPPFDPKVAPDGSLVAYATIAAVVYPDCAYCISTYDQALYSHPDRLTRYGEIPGPMCCSDPSWVGSDTVMLTNGSATTWYHRRGAPEASEWFSDFDTGAATGEHLHDGEIAPTGDKLAIVRGFDPESLALYRMNGSIPATPSIRCGFSGAERRSGADYTSPTWSPDGRALAWEEAAGIMVAPVASLDDCAAIGPARVVVPGGTDPDWSPAPVAAPSSPAPPGADRLPRARAGVAVPGGQRLARALRRGAVATISCDGPCRVSGRLTAGGRIVARGRARLRSAGTAAMRLRFTPRARRELAGRRALRATLLIRGPGVAPARRKVVLR